MKNCGRTSQLIMGPSQQVAGPFASENKKSMEKMKLAWIFPLAGETDVPVFTSNGTRSNLSNVKNLHNIVHILHKHGPA